MDHESACGGGRVDGLMETAKVDASFGEVVDGGHEMREGASVISGRYHRDLRQFIAWKYSIALTTMQPSIGLQAEGLLKDTRR